MKRLSFYIIIIALSGMLASCEKTISLDLPDGADLPYIDAWINDKPGPQTIKFLRATNYLDNTTPPTISGAQVVLTDITSNKTYDFAWKDGAYVHDPGAGERVGVIGHEYKLSITWNGELFEATDKLNRVPAIDSMTYEYKKKDDGDVDEDGYFAKFFARDLPGGTDYYWVRAYKNGVLNQNTPEQWSIDGSFYPDVSDGNNFIVPIREGITSDDHPYQVNDVVKVQIRSLSKNSYEFIRLMSDQLTNGGLFAKVLANVPANMASKKAGSTNRIYGWFATVAESEMEITIKE